MREMSTVSRCTTLCCRRHLPSFKGQGACELQQLPRRRAMQLQDGPYGGCGRLPRPCGTQAAQYGSVVMIHV